jgi:hypothetical protein
VLYNGEWAHGDLGMVVRVCDEALALALGPAIATPPPTKSTTPWGLWGRHPQS